MSISDERLAALTAEVGQNSNRMLEHAIFPGWWLEVHLALTELQSLRAAAKVRAIRDGDGGIEQSVSNEQLREWVLVRSDDAGRLARELIQYRSRQYDVPAGQRAASIAKIHAHHALWGGLVPYGWGEEVGKFGVGLANRIAESIVHGLALPDAPNHFCGLPDFGTYAGQVTLVPPPWMQERWPTGIGIDVCLALEIQQLWAKGIHTTGHCCGHGKADAFISVEDAYVQAMLDLGYVGQAHPVGGHFWPKTMLTGAASPIPATGGEKE